MSNTRREVVVTDIHMPFWSILIFMVKFTVASIPAMIIAAIIVGAIVTAGFDDIIPAKLSDYPYQSYSWKATVDRRRALSASVFFGSEAEIIAQAWRPSPYGQKRPVR